MTSHAAPNWSRIAREILGEFLKWFAAAWLVIIVITSGIIAVIAYFGTPSVSIVDAVFNAPRYWLFVVGLVFTYTWLGPYLGVGVTRRDFLRAGAVVGLTSALLLGVMSTLTMFAEGGLYAAQGWETHYEQSHLFADYDQVGLMLVEYSVVFGSHFFAGWALGSMFYRHSAWAILAAVPVFAFAVGSEITAGSGWIGKIMRDNVSGYEPSWILALTVGIAVVAALYGLVWHQTRDVAIVARKT